MKNNVIKLGLSVIILIAGLFFLKENLLEAIGLPYFLIAIGCGLCGNQLSILVRDWAFKKDATAKQAYEIETRDERNIQIEVLAKAKGFDLMTFSLGALMLAYALMKESLPIILSLVAVFMVIQGYTLFWRLKLDKQM